MGQSCIHRFDTKKTPYCIFCEFKPSKKQWQKIKKSKKETEKAIKRFFIPALTDAFCKLKDKDESKIFHTALKKTIRRYKKYLKKIDKSKYEQIQKQIQSLG